MSSGQNTLIPSWQSVVQPSAIIDEPLTTPVIPQQTRSRLLKSLPQSLQVPDDGWTETTERNRRYELVLESEFQDIDLSEEISCTYQNIAKQVVLAPANQGLDTSSVNIFPHLLSESTIVKSLNGRLKNW